jgi:acyl carrier protein
MSETETRITEAEIEQRVRQYIVGNLRFFGSPETLTSDYRLIDKGVLDSMAIFEVISFIEDTYGIQVEDRELGTENFESLSAIAKLVAAKALV